MKTVTLTAPSAWASALVNGDYGGLDPDDVAALNAFCEREGVNPAQCLTCDDAGFRWRHDASPETPLGADCQEYVFALHGESA